MDPFNNPLSIFSLSVNCWFTNILVVHPVNNEVIKLIIPGGTFL